MNPRTHPRGARPDFTLPRPNPNPARMTDALWWLVCMREALEPEKSESGGTYAAKPGSHNIGASLPDHGAGDARTDHSIRHAWNRTGPWWRTKTAAHDWTFRDAQRGDYRTINRYTRRMITAMADPHDLRPDRVVFYTLGNLDGDVTTEGYHELTNAPETSSDDTHAWHRHDSFFRNIVGDFGAMWKVLTIDMGWTYTEWRQSTQEDDMESTLSDGDIDRIVKALIRTDVDPSGTHAYSLGGVLWVMFQRIAVLAGRDDVDEQAVVAGVLAGLSAERIAAAIPADLAEQVAGRLFERLAP